MWRRPRLGIVMLPAIFGSSISFRWKALRLRLSGYLVRTIDLYRGQSFGRPLTTHLTGSADERERLDELAARLNDDPIFQQMEDTVLALYARCGQVALVGFGIGGTYALRYVGGTELGGVVAWYPPLIFPHDFPKESPHCERIRCPVVLFYGHDDNVLAPGTVDYGLRLARSHDDIETFGFPHAGHAFADAFIQYCIPNSLWRPRASWQSWRIALRHLAHWTRADS